MLFGPEWIPVYLDEMSAAFVRRRPENEGFDQLRVDCNAPKEGRRRKRLTAFERRRQRKYGPPPIPLLFPCRSAAIPLVIPLQFRCSAAQGILILTT